MKKEEGRKTRSDKKKAIAPFISDEQRVWIHRIARRCEEPEGVVGLNLIEEALREESCIEFFSSYFKRDYRFAPNIVYCGHDDCNSIYTYLMNSPQRSRFKVKPSLSTYECLCEFQIALGIPYLAHATYALLQFALHDIKIVHMICPQITCQQFIAPPTKIISPVGSKDSNVWSILK